MKEIKLDKGKIILLDKSKVTTLKGKRPKKALFLEIEKIPKDINLNVKDEFVIIDDEFYVLDYHNPKSAIITGLSIILFSIILHFGVNGYSISGLFWITGLIFLFGLCVIIKALIITNEKVIMDRKQGLFSYPNYYSNKPALINFSEAILIFVYKGGKMPYPTLIAPYTNVKFGGFTLTSFEVKDQLSLYVWYMDKNRPLPPGGAFDAYREKDFERRKAEGFPPPLYYSNGVLTPEVTPEQQAEREHYWKDREYFAPAIKRPEDSEIFNKRTHPNWSTIRFENNETGIAISQWHEITFSNGKKVYMLTDENGKGYLPPEDEKYNIASLILEESWY